MVVPADDPVECAEWMAANPENDADPAGFKDCVVLRVERGGKTAGYLPVHKLLFTGAFAPRPGSTEIERLRAISEVIDTLLEYGEDIYYLSRGNTKLDEYGQRHYGYKLLPYKVYRLRPKHE